MKTLNSIAITAAIVAFQFTVSAAETVLSPKAAQLQHELRKVPSASSDVDLISNRPAGNAAAWSLAQDFRKVPSTGRDLNLAHAPRPAFSPKDPRYEMQLRENAINQMKLGKTTAAR